MNNSWCDIHFECASLRIKKIKIKVVVDTVTAHFGYGVILQFYAVLFYNKMEIELKIDHFYGLYTNLLNFKLSHVTPLCKSF